MDWKEEYRKKLMSPEEAIHLLHDHWKIFIDHVASDPQVLVKELVKQREHFSDLTLVQMFTLGSAPYCERGMEKHFHYVSLFAGPSTRNILWENRGEFIPCFFHRIPALLKSEDFNLNAAVIQVSPPDENGYCSYGVNCDCIKGAAEAAHVVIAEVNDKMPYIMGDNFIHISKLDGIVEVSYPIHAIPLGSISTVEQKIGEYCSQLIDDGSTLQLGIGSIPDAVLQNLTDKKDLGIHSEMFSDRVMDLMKSGVINGAKKSLHPGKVVASFIMGTQKLYDFVDHNPDVELYPVDYVNSPRIIGMNDNMVSINSCLEVDFNGQLNAESIGGKQFSGVGGQVDFIRGVAVSKNGKSIIAMPSTAQNGTTSRIVPVLANNAVVTTSRNDVDYIVTEYGIAKLSGKSTRARALSLINIAHPGFREELMENFRTLYEF